jgi:hypothetical protein
MNHPHTIRSLTTLPERAPASRLGRVLVGSSVVGLSGSVVEHLGCPCIEAVPIEPEGDEDGPW